MEHLRPLTLRRGPLAHLATPPSRRWWLWTIFGVLAFSGAGLLSALLPEQFAVTAVDVLDARPHLADDIRRYVQGVIEDDATIRGKTNIFLVPRTKLERDIPSTFPVVHTVQILRKLPSTVRVVVQEKVPVVLLFAGGTYYALDPAGVAFEIVPVERLPDNTLPVLRDERPDARVELGQAVLPVNVLSALHDLVSALPERFRVTAKEITIPAIGSEEVRVRTHEGWLLLLDTRRPLAEQFAVLEKIFAEEIDDAERRTLEYVDLRVRGKAFFKTRGP